MWEKSWMAETQALRELTASSSKPTLPSASSLWDLHFTWCRPDTYRRGLGFTQPSRTNLDHYIHKRATSSFTSQIITNRKLLITVDISNFPDSKQSLWFFYILKIRNKGIGNKLNVGAQIPQSTGKTIRGPHFSSPPILTSNEKWSMLFIGVLYKKALQ